METACEVAVVADKDECGAGRIDLSKQQVEEGMPCIRVEGGCGFVGDDQRGGADARAGKCVCFLPSVG